MAGGSGLARPTLWALCSANAERWAGGPYICLQLCLPPAPHSGSPVLQQDPGYP